MNTIQFNQEFNQVSEKLRVFALHLTKDTHNADDLFQETAMRAFCKKHLFQKDTNFKSWTTMIMRNLFYTSYRNKKKREMVFSGTESLLSNLSSQNTTNAGEQKMLFDDVNKKLNTLKREFKVPFVLRQQGYNYNEISSYLNIPVGTAKSRVFFARKKMKEQLVLD